MPVLARSVSPAAGKASSVMNSDTVNPIPARAASPTTWRVARPSGSLPTRRRTAARLPMVIPRILPPTRPRATPQAIGLVAAARNGPVPSGRPALASANSGTTR